MTAHKKLKIGILLDSYLLPHWAFVALERVIQSLQANIDLVVLREQVKSSRLKQNRTKYSKIVYQFLNRLDGFLFKGSLAYAVPTSIEPFLKNIDTVQYPSTESDINVIKAKQLDILVYLGCEQLSENIFELAKYGMWTYQLGNPEFNRGGPAGFWEAVTRQASTGAVLKMLGQNEQILYRSEVMTRAFKPTQNKHQYHYLAAGFLSRQINLLADLGEEQFFNQVKKFNPELDFYSYPDFQEPDNIEALSLLIQYIWNLGTRVIRKLFYYEHWYLFYCLNPNESNKLHQYKKLLPPADRFWADPHVIFENDRYYLFFEELMYNTNRGHISAIEMDQEGNCKQPVSILKADYHLSYPFVFKHNEKYYMVPESVENKTIQLYECTNFPYQWEFKMNLMEDIETVDTTLFYQDNKWWLFTAIEDVKGSFYGDELYLFWSDDLFSQQWNSHPLNPIISGVATARPAGKIFVHNNRLYRPSQDCSVRYGHCTNFNEITELSEQAYSEKKVSAITPNWDKQVLGTHTFNQEGNLTIVDAYYDRFRFFNKD